MTNQDSDGMFENDWDDRSELSWNEKDWETYLADQDQAVRNYQKTYDSLPASPSRIDQVARQLGWETAEDEEDSGETEEELLAEENLGDRWEPYTLHRNPVYVATRALYLSLLARWDAALVVDAKPVALGAVALQGSLHQGQDIVLHGIHALEMGDYTLAVCFFKRALRELNRTMALGAQLADAGAPEGFAAYARPRLFDLREILLRVMNECRSEDVDGDTD